MTKQYLEQLYENHEGKVSDKWSIYIKEYDNILSTYRNKAISLFEIGIQNGGSLEIWSRYFQKGRLFVGCDINEKCKQLEYDDSRIKVIVGDANSERTQRDVLDTSRQFDIIIDDGSHRSSDIIRSFSLYFPHLSDGGIYIVEDLHCSYWKNFEGGLEHPHSSISFFKSLVDIINHEHWGINKSRDYLLKNFSKTYGVAFNEEALLEIHSIEFINSICVIHKSSAKDNVLGRRIVTGETADVVPSIKERHDTVSGAQDQSENTWSNREMTIHEEVGERISELECMRKDILSLKQDIDIYLEENKKLQTTIQEKSSLISEYFKKTSIDKISLAKQKKHIVELESSVRQKDMYIDALRNSASWRITAPYRFLGNSYKNASKTPKHFVKAIRDRGGLLPTAKLTLNAFRKKGLRGVRERLFQVASEKKDYSTWVQHYSTVTPQLRDRITALIEEMEQRPTISIVMPVYNPKIEWLRAAISSVQAQLYENWQLCIADDCSADPEVRSVLQTFQNEDSRIEVVFREENGHISRASNSAIELVTGSWIALMDQDDLLTEDALFHVARAIEAHPDAGLIYSDEDKIDENGTRFAPYFKSDWNPDLFLSHNMITHLGVYRAEMVRDIGGFRPDYNGSQDYDLALRFIEKLQPGQIVHIPRVLYHWRSHAESTAEAGTNKGYALEAGERALEDYLRRTKRNATVEQIDYGYRVRYDLPSPAPFASLIIPTRNGLMLLRQCIESILDKTAYPNYEIIVIDNGSDDPDTLEYLSGIMEHEQITVIRDERPFNYSALNNSAVATARGTFIGLINNDIEVISPGWLEEMISLASQPGVGAVGASLWYPDDTLQHGGVIIGLGGVAGHAHKRLPRGEAGYCARAKLIQTMTAVTAACLIVEKAKYEEVGGLNEKDLTVAFNDVDLCLKLREAGYRNIWTPFAELYHHESATRGLDTDPEKVQRFQSEIAYMQERWSTDDFNDPAYSPNLTLNMEDFSLAWPSRAPSI